MAKNYMTYWRPRTVDAQEGPLLGHSAGGQFQKVEPGDTVWIVTVRPPGQLMLLGCIVVGFVTDYEGAKKALHTSDIWDASWHIIAEPGTERLLHEVDITSIASQLRFESEGAPRLNIVGDHVDARQLQAMRTLTPESAQLLEACQTVALSFWWVNHKQTFKAELAGGYIWSPKTANDGRRMQTYDNLTSVNPGDVIFSYANGLISAVGVATAEHREEPKPLGFGGAGKSWADVGWLVPVEWTDLQVPIEPKKHMAVIGPLLPRRHSPIRANGKGDQGCYLAAISAELGDLLLQLAQDKTTDVIDSIAAHRNDAEADAQEAAIRGSAITETEKDQLIKSRRGQGRFRSNVRAIESRCRLTGTSNAEFLVASHIKPWADSSNTERLDGNNGLLLAPHVDKLFDGGWITFTDTGDLLCADETVHEVMRTWGLRADGNVGAFNARQKGYLAYHRMHVFRGDLPA